MREEVRKEILEILDKAIEILKVKEEWDISQLSNLSDEIINSAIIFEDEDAVSIAILIYALYKMLARKTHDDIIYTQVEHELINARKILETRDEDGYRGRIKYLFDLVNRIDTELSKYFQELIGKAKIKKGSTLFEHGLSIAKVSDVVGISQWELMDYIGKTKVFDVETHETDAKVRVTLARKIFGMEK